MTKRKRSKPRMGDIVVGVKCPFCDNKQNYLPSSMPIGIFNNHKINESWLYFRSIHCKKCDKYYLYKDSKSREIKQWGIK